MSGAFEWSKRYGWMLVLGALAFLAYFLRLSSTTPGRVLERERRAIDAGETARIATAEAGRDKANAQIDHEHAAALRELDRKQAAKADRMRADPGARARWLSRLSD